MTTAYRRSAICYGNPGTWFYPAAGIEQSDTEPEQVERYDYVAADGTKASYFVGERRFIERTFRWQSDTLLDTWRVFWRTHAGQGKEFWYYEATPPICGQAGNAGGGKYCGGPDVAGVVVYADTTEFRPEREDAWGYRTIGLMMRRMP